METKASRKKYDVHAYLIKKQSVSQIRWNKKININA